MRFLSFDKNGRETVAVRFGSELVDISIAAPELPRTLLGLLRADALERAGAAALRADATARRAAAGITYLPVIPDPPKLFGFGINYGSHVGTRPSTPGFFLSGPHRLVGQDEPIEIPNLSKTLDYEIELAFVVSKSGRHIAASDALNHVGGYTIFNDASVRGYGAGLTLALMKNSDKTGPLGPELVTPDELPLGCDGLSLITRRNGKVVQSDNTSNMFWKVPEIIELTTKYMSLNVGDVVTTGTCGGTVVEVARAEKKEMSDETLPWLQPGDVIECEIEGIGVLRNSVIREPQR
jgi:acylpyruvate hydrolase